MPSALLQYAEDSAASSRAARSSPPPLGRRSTGSSPRAPRTQPSPSAPLSRLSRTRIPHPLRCWPQPSTVRTFSPFTTRSFTCLPGAGARERGPGVLPAGTVSAASARLHLRSGQILHGPERRGRRRRHHDDERVPEQVHARGLVDQPALVEVVHPIRVGGEEEIRGRRRLDLLRQSRRRVETERHLGMTGRSPLRADRLQRTR